MARKPASASPSVPEPDAKPPVTRDGVAEALMRLAANEPWDTITLPMIAAEAGATLAELRELFPPRAQFLASSPA